MKFIKGIYLNIIYFCSKVLKENSLLIIYLLYTQRNREQAELVKRPSSAPLTCTYQRDVTDNTKYAHFQAASTDQYLLRNERGGAEALQIPAGGNCGYRWIESKLSGWGEETFYWGKLTAEI